MLKTILISVTDKNNLDQFKRLTDIGWNILSTGGTAKALTTAGILCTLVEEITDFPEMMGGRLKTLHPKIFGGILANRSKETDMIEAKDYGINMIDMVVANLYNFEGKPGIENIDIGGPSLLRAAAKNGISTIPLCNPLDYEPVISEIIEKGDVSIETRVKLVYQTFVYTARYDHVIAEWMKEEMFNNKNFLQDVSTVH